MKQLNTKVRINLENIPLAFWIVTGILGLGLLVWKIPQYHASLVVPSAPNREELLSKRFDVENKSRATFLQAVGGLFFLVTAYFSWRNLQNAEDKQHTDRFSKAVELLSAEKIESRLGGIYLLERIAYDSPEDYWTVMEVLTAYVRENSPRPSQSQKGKHGHSNNESLVTVSCSTDIQAVLTVIGRRKVKVTEPAPLDLANTYLGRIKLVTARLAGADFQGADLREANLTEADLRGIDFNGANLTEIDLRGTDLRGADLGGCRLVDAKFCGANLSGSNLSGGNLREADLSGTNLSKVDLFGVNLSRANLSGANLHGASLIEAELIEADLIETDLSGVYLISANLRGANLHGSNLSGASLDGADLVDANLLEVKNLYLQQLQEAKNWENGHYSLDG